MVEGVQGAGGGVKGGKEPAKSFNMYLVYQAGRYPDVKLLSKKTI